jgi:hypothetical protein
MDEKAKINPDLEWIDNSNFSDGLLSELIKVKHAKRDNNHYYIGLNQGVGNPIFKNERIYANMKYPDPGFRMLCLYRYWNIIQYYFPYKNLIEEDWKDVLKEFLPKFIQASDETAYKLAVLELIGRVHDTHANIWSRDEALKFYFGSNYAPVIVAFIENKALVTGFYEQKPPIEKGLQVGDIITAINGEPVEDVVLKKLKFSPASNYPTQLRDIARSLLRTNKSSLTVEFTRNEIADVKEIETYPADKINIYQVPQKPDTCFKMITTDIGYLYPGSVKNKYLPEIMDKMKNTKGLIIDFRCYPSDFIVFSLNEYLMPEPTGFVTFSNGNITQPGLFTMTKTLKAGKSNKDYYKGKVVILVNETTQSSAEYHTMAFRAVPGATVIGSTTAAADGNVSQIYLPGEIKTMISGIGVYYPDGKETQRTGIVPDLEIRPTIEGIKSGKDEVLEKAIDFITKDS